ncbi:chloride channel protein [Tsukamurella sp. 8F]|uniref:chloride channel protein n=1 Tax=unclassified Tsukamurella TaxID=2633480 RepID=UPI0023B98E20|nr:MULTISPECIES: chloride channel protein [unclassified Tsukamurella]MDF0530279.1 chloride channel protein [Tsukamurella sp. 8J]MDF0588597.1 chloride channel protein [Tsukamurella sp. 8F]
MIRPARLVTALVVAGIVAGVAGGGCAVVLRLIQHVVYDYASGSLLDGVTSAGPARRVVVPAVGGIVAGLGWWALRRRATVPRLRAVVELPGRLPWRALVPDALLQIVAVATGGSIGREKAPRQLAAVFADAATLRFALSDAERRLVLAGAAGAGLAAVYNVPGAGALFALRVLLATWEPWAVVACVVTSACATLTALPVTRGESTYAWHPTGPGVITDAGAATWVAAAVIVPLAALAGVLFTRLMRWADRRHPPGWALPGMLGVAGVAVGLSSLWLPSVAGNGKSIATLALVTGAPLGAYVVLLVLKPALTALYLRSGASGGLLTPSFATGAALGAVVALVCAHWLPGASVQVCALIGAAAMVSTTEDAPLFAGVFAWELAHPQFALLAVLVAVAVAVHHGRRRAGAIMTPRDASPGEPREHAGG